jgi:hypothetical protein
MTLRLVALMSVVLLLSLAAFGLLVNHYQDEVMAEVARTASAAGRAALGSLEFGPHVQSTADNSFVAGNEVFVFSAPFDAADDDAVLETNTNEAEVAGGLRQVRRVIERYTESDGEHDRHVIAVRYHEGAFEEVSVTGEAIDCEIVAQADTGRCVTTGGSDETKIVGEFIFSLDEIHAEPDATDGLVLTIPRKAPDAMMEKVIDRVKLDAMPFGDWRHLSDGFADVWALGRIDQLQVIGLTQSLFPILREGRDGTTCETSDQQLKMGGCFVDLYETILEKHTFSCHPGAIAGDDGYSLLAVHFGVLKAILQ